ncbi:MAG: DUF3617 family protein [Thermodesulfobacteriota bacterium]|nr:DUF3617 family protein [Thermodesulfobacteriota bacterium]
MKSQNLLIVLIAAITVFSGNAFAGANINPGLWEITTETEMVGMQGMNVPSETHTQCLSRGGMVPQSKEASKECQITDVRESGDTIFWNIICSGQNGSMEGTGEVTYHGNSLDGVMNMVIMGANMQLKNTIRGHRIGECATQQTTIEQQQPVKIIPNQHKSTEPTVADGVQDDVKDVGQAGRGEAKQTTTDEVRDSVNTFIKGLFD